MIENQHKYNKSNSRGSINAIYAFEWRELLPLETITYDYLGLIDQLNGGYTAKTDGYEVDYQISAEQIRVNEQTNNEFFDLNRRRLILICTDEAGQSWLFGKSSGMDVDIEIDSGKNRSEFSGYQIDASGKDEYFPIEITELENVVFLELFNRWENESQRVESRKCLLQILKY